MIRIKMLDALEHNADIALIFCAKCKNDSKSSDEEPCSSCTLTLSGFEEDKK